ncbi:MAG: bifunctional riboflavin kinase/FAD synthetase [Oscillospiraceae bacterium]|nr:bifunctional riboflavin kinase/FAD synthetase [Oscillospiraceae bacterium]
MNRNCSTSCVALGYFDGVHLGHKEVIKTALSLTQYESAVFTFNNREADNITTDEAKKKLLTNLGVKQIFSYDFEETKNFSAEEFVSEILIKELRAGAVCCGFDFRFGKGAEAGTDELMRICERHRIVTIIVPPVELGGTAVSSSAIRKLIADGDVESANKLLGHELFYELEVVGGNKQGRTIGFPTINQNMPKDCTALRFGVYSSRVAIKSKRNLYRGITNIGVKPTAGENNNVTIETHIIGYDGDLYGKSIEVNLLKFIRPEKKFNSFEELTKQIKEDLKWLK